MRKYPSVKEKLKGNIDGIFYDISSSEMDEVEEKNIDNEDDFLVSACQKLKENAYKMKNDISDLLGIEITVQKYHIPQKRTIFSPENNQNQPQKEDVSIQTSAQSSQTTENVQTTKNEDTQIEEKPKEEENENENLNEESNDFDEQTNDAEPENESVQESQHPFLSSTSLSYAESSTATSPKRKSSSEETKTEEKKNESPLSNKIPAIRPSGFKQVKSNGTTFRYPLGYYAQKNVFNDMAPLDFSQNP